MNLGVPVSVTRRGLYILTILGAVFFVLLPFSCIGYYEFYHSLIPEPSPRVPLNFYTTTEAKINLGASNTAISHYQFDDLLVYQWNINLHVVCGNDLTGRVVQLQWLVFQDDTEIHTDTFIIDCDTRFIHNSNNWVIPYNLRFWVPPVTVDVTRLVMINLDKYTILGKQLSQSKEYSIVIDHCDGLIIDNDDLYLDFRLELTGFRWYLRKYWLTCAAMGIGFFWWLNSIFTVSTSLLVLGVDNENDDDNVITQKDDDDLMAYE